MSIISASMSQRGWFTQQWVCLAGIMLLVVPYSWGISHAASKISAVLTVKDALTTPNHPARIVARLVQKGMLTETGLGGESLQLEIAGKVVGTAMTGGDGRAYFEYSPTMRGNFQFVVTLSASPRVETSKASGLLGVWEHRRPILLLEDLALVEDHGDPSGLSLPIGKRSLGEWKPQPDAAEELSRLAQFYYNVIYLLDHRAENAEFRTWLNEHKFPVGVIIQMNQGTSGLGTLLDDLKKDGWTATKNGIGRSRGFAETLLEHRMEVVIVPEPSKGDTPRKAKIAKNWKEVRKQL
ncbi:MAG: hypothetical protein ABW047_11350 [Nitrospiraceae bacterium]